MEYSNPKIPEEINYSKENSLKEFGLLVVGIFLVLAVFIICVHLFAQNFAHHIPFKYEEKIMPSSFDFGISDKDNITDAERHLAQKKQLYLASLAEKLTSNMNLPDEMQIHINYINTDIINAGATLNGQILIYQGLLDYVESENELAMVIAHEIAHIKARHPIKALSSSVIIGIVMAIISGSTDSSGAASVLTSGTMLTSLKFSRQQENEADKLALHALHAHYGHTLGSTDFFRRLSEDNKISDHLTFLSTHPSSKKRVKTLQSLIKELPNKKPQDFSLTTLPRYLTSD